MYRAGSAICKFKSVFKLFSDSGVPGLGARDFSILPPPFASHDVWFECTADVGAQDFLCKIWNPPSMYPAYLQVTDIAGLIKGASEGAGLGNAFLSHIQAVDGMYHVVRAFDNDEVLHVDDSVDPVRDLGKWRRLKSHGRERC